MISEDFVKSESEIIKEKLILLPENWRAPGLRALFRMDGLLDGRCQLARHLKGIGKLDEYQQMISKYQREKNVCKFKTPEKESVQMPPNAPAEAKGLNILYRKDGQIDGRCQYARYMKSQGLSVSSKPKEEVDISQLNIKYRKDGEIDGRCQYARYMKSQEIASNPKSIDEVDISKLNIIYRKDGQIDGRCQYARYMKQAGLSVEEMNSMSFEEEESVVEIVSPPKNDWSQDKMKASDFQPTFKQVLQLNISEKKNGGMDKRCQLFNFFKKSFPSLAQSQLFENFPVKNFQLLQTNENTLINKIPLYVISQAYDSSSETEIKQSLWSLIMSSDLTTNGTPLQDDFSNKMREFSSNMRNNNMIQNPDGIIRIILDQIGLNENMKEIVKWTSEDIIKSQNQIPKKESLNE